MSRCIVTWAGTLFNLANSSSVQAVSFLYYPVFQPLLTRTLFHR